MYVLKSLESVLKAINNELNAFLIDSINNDYIYICICTPGSKSCGSIVTSWSKRTSKGSSWLLLREEKLFKIIRFMQYNLFIILHIFCRCAFYWVKSLQSINNFLIECTIKLQLPQYTSWNLVTFIYFFLFFVSKDSILF